MASASLGCQPVQDGEKVENNTRRPAQRSKRHPIERADYRFSASSSFPNRQDVGLRELHRGAPHEKGFIATTSGSAAAAFPGAAPEGSRPAARRTRACARTDESLSFPSDFGCSVALRGAGAIVVAGAGVWAEFSGAADSWVALTGAPAAKIRTSKNPLRRMCRIISELDGQKSGNVSSHD